MSDNTVLTLRLNRETKEALEKLAADTHRSKSYVAATAVETYVKRQLWWQEKIDSARRSELVPEEEMEAFFAARSIVDA